MILMNGKKKIELSITANKIIKEQNFNKESRIFSYIYMYL